jgi:hypothetical protein
MANKQENRDTRYEGDRDTTPHKETGNINARNNLVEASTPGPDEATVEGANNVGIGDAAVNDQKLTSHTSNHSADA